MNDPVSTKHSCTFPDLAHIAICDMRGIVRGRGFMAACYDDYLADGCGWTPANQLLSAFDDIAPDNPFGALGDLRFRPDPATRTRLSLPGSRLDLTLSDIVTPAGEPWECCTRSFLKNSIARYAALGSGTVIAAFESEFTLSVDPDHAAPAFSVLAQRKRSDFLSEFMGLLHDGGIAPEMIFAEHGPGQYEVTIAPADPLRAADRIILLREILRELAWRHGIEATFAPVPHPGGNTNGVHIHIGFIGPQGEALGYDAARPGCLSEHAGKFARGILQSYPAVCALTAPSVPSYRRLRPGCWSAGYGYMALRDREAALRICPAPTPRHDPAASHHLEFRAADATACPYLALGALLHAGADGLAGDESEPVREGTTGIEALRGPATLGEALDAFEHSGPVRAWTSPLFRDVFLSCHRNEMNRLSGWSDEDISREYARVY